MLQGLEETSLARYKTGRLPQQAVLRMQREITAQRIALVEIEQRRKGLAAGLNGLLGRTHDAPLDAPAQPPPLPERLVIGPLYEALANANPEVNVATFGIETARAERARTYQDRLPDFAVGVRNSRPDGRRASWDVMFEVTIPLQQSSRRAKEREAEQMLLAAEARREDARSRAAGELGTAWSMYAQGAFVKRAQQAVAEEVEFPQGYYATWSGQFENMERAKEKMKVVVPMTLALIFVLLYLNFRRLSETLIVMLSVPFALVGGIWLMWWLGYQMSVAVAVGFIALAGVAAETGVIMLIYLDHAWKDVRERRQAVGRDAGVADLYEAIMEGAVERVRPKMMTVVAIMAGLLPIMWGSGTGSEVMSRIAAPMVGGMVSSTVLTLAVIPAIYALVKQWELRRRRHQSMPVVTTQSNY